MDKKEIKEKIEDLVEEATGICVGEEDLLLEDEIIDSVSILYIITELEECYSIRIELEQVTEEHFRSVNNITDYILSKM